MDHADKPTVDLTADTECSQVVTDVLGYQLPFTRSPSRKAEESGTSQVQTQLKAVRRRKPAVKRPVTVKKAGQVVAECNGRSIHLVSEDEEEEDWFKHPGQSKKKKSLNPPASTVWEQPLKSLPSFCLEDQSEEEIIQLLTTIYREYEIDPDWLPITSTIILLFIVLRDEAKIDIMFNVPNLKTPNSKSFSDLKAVWETIDMADSLTSVWTSWTEFVGAAKKQLTDNVGDWLVSSVTDIRFGSDDISRMSLCRRDMSMLIRSLRKLRVSPNCPSSAITMDFGSSRNTTTTFMSPTHAPTVTDRVDAVGSLTAQLGEDGDDLDFDEELSSLASRLATGTGSLDITLQTAESPFTLSAEKRMEEFVYEVKIYR